MLNTRPPKPLSSSIIEAYFLRDFVIKNVWYDSESLPVRWLHYGLIDRKLIVLFPVRQKNFSSSKYLGRLWVSATLPVAHLAGVIATVCWSWPLTCIKYQNSEWVQLFPYPYSLHLTPFPFDIMAYTRKTLLLWWKFPEERAVYRFVKTPRLCIILYIVIWYFESRYLMWLLVL